MLLSLSPSQIVAAQADVRFDMRRDTALTDEKLQIVLRGARPGQFVTIRLAGADNTSQATYVVDRRGRVDLSRAAPIRGSYAGADAMGLFWSAQRTAPTSTSANRPDAAGANRAVPFQLVAESDGVVLATDTVWRAPVAASVRVTPVRENGLVGVLYEPAGTERRAAIMVLAGSGGGIPAPANWPGGLASRGYVVLSLAHFAAPGVPEHLANIPLEYLERALRWMRARSSVDSTRIGVLGTSRGGELALLVGATYPRLVNAVVAVVPSSVVWPGCCDAASRLGPSWTLRGAPVPFMPPDSVIEAQVNAQSQFGAVSQTAVHLYRLEDSAAVTRAAIPVERIAGPVLLISGRADGVWPSYEMSQQVMARLAAHRFPHPYKHLAYEGAGHMILRPGVPLPSADAEIDPRRGRRNDFGGVMAMTARAREASWADLLAFLDRSLRSGRSGRRP